jgi:hypothetical protein
MTHDILTIIIILLTLDNLTQSMIHYTYTQTYDVLIKQLVFPEDGVI